MFFWWTKTEIKNPVTFKWVKLLVFNKHLQAQQAYTKFLQGPHEDQLS